MNQSEAERFGHREYESVAHRALRWSLREDRRTEVALFLRLKETNPIYELSPKEKQRGSSKDIHTPQPTRPVRKALVS